MFFIHYMTGAARCGIVILSLFSVASCASTGGVDRQSKLLSDRFYELLAAEFAIQLDDKQQSLEHYYKAALLTRDKAVYRAAIALAVSLGDYQKAKILANQWYKSDADDIELNQIMALIYLQAQDYSGALRYIEVLLDREAEFDSRQVLPLLGTLEFEKSRAVIVKLEQAMPERAAVYWLKSYLAFYHGRYQEALSVISQALQRDPHLSKAIALKADILFALDRDAEALDWLSQQALLHPHSFLLQAKVALSLQNHGHIVPAQRFYQAAYRLNSEQTTFILQYALFNINENQLAMAQQLLARYVTFGGDPDVASYYKAAIAEKRGDLQAAIDYYRAVATDKLRAEVALNIAEIYQMQGLFAKGDEQFRALRGRDKSEEEQVRYYIAQTTALREGGFIERALHLYDEALAQYPDSLSLLYSRGMLRLEMGQFDLFKQDLQRVIELDPDNWQALNALGYTLVDLNLQLAQAGTYIRRAYQLNPTEPAVIDSMGWLEFRLKNLEAAERYIEKAASLFHDAEILGHWVEILLSTHRHDEAARRLNEALDDFPQSDYLLRLQKQIAQ